jgi:hypothetical protein
MRNRARFLERGSRGKMFKIKGRAGFSKVRKAPEPTRRYLEVAAYYHWKERGCPFGESLVDWLAAEREWRIRYSPNKWWQTKQDIYHLG